MKGAFVAFPVPVPITGPYGAFSIATIRKWSNWSGDIVVVFWIVTCVVAAAAKSMREKMATEARVVIGCMAR